MIIRYSEYDSPPAGRRRACVRYTHEDFFARFRILAPALVPLHARATKVDCEALLRLAESPTPSADAESKGAPHTHTHTHTHARAHTHTPFALFPFRLAQTLRMHCARLTGQHTEVR